MMKKKLFSFLAVFCLLLSLFVTFASANSASDVTTGGEPYHIESQIVWSLLYEALDDSSDSPRRAFNYADFSSFYANSDFFLNTNGEESLVSYGNPSSTILISHIRSYNVKNYILRLRNLFSVSNVDSSGGVYMNSLRVYGYNAIKPARDSASNLARNPFPVFIFYGSILEDFGYISSSLQIGITQFIDNVKYEYWIDESDILSLVNYGYDSQVSSEQYYVHLDLNSIIVNMLNENYPNNTFDITERFMVNYLNFKPFDYDYDILVNGSNHLNFISELPLSSASAIDELNAFMNDYSDDDYYTGFRDGQIDGMSINNIPKFLDNVVEPFFTTELFPGFSIGGLLSVILGALLMIWLLRLIAGG